MKREDVIEAAKKAAHQMGGRDLSRGDFERLTGIGQYWIYKLFPTGGFQEVVESAGLRVNPGYHRPMSDEALLAEFHRVATTLKTIPTWPRFAAEAKVSRQVVQKRFGGLGNTLKQYREWLLKNDPSSPMLPLLEARLSKGLPTQSANLVSAVKGAQWIKTEGTEYGSPLNFRGLRHASVNEQGVVYLFGMVSTELGFLVEAVHTAYPDCDAKRCVDRTRDRWQRVRIEFEFHSSNFRDGGHDPSRCDLIVCWEHDWADCPLEVIELQSVLKQLEG